MKTILNIKSLILVALMAMVSVGADARIRKVLPPPPPPAPHTTVIVIEEVDEPFFEGDRPFVERRVIKKRIPPRPKKFIESRRAPKHPADEPRREPMPKDREMRR